jgi:hypothetical protein
VTRPPRARLVLSPLWLLVALATVLGLGASSAAAASGPETRVRALDHPAALAVAVHEAEGPASVGCLRPPQPAIASGSCVATNTADDIAGLADDYIDITAKGSRVRNVQTSVSRSSFEQNLIEAGYQPTVVSPGKNVVSYELNGTRYVVRDAATSTGGPTADFYPVGSSSFTLKIRLGG